MSTRTTVGFLVAPIAVPIGLLFTDWLIADAGGWRFEELLFSVVVWYFFPLLFALIFALPLYLLLNRFDLVRWWSALGDGLIVGALGALTINGQTQTFFAKLTVLSGISGLIFYFVAKYKYRPTNPSRLS